MEDQREDEEWELIGQLKAGDCRDRYLWSTRIDPPPPPRKEKVIYSKFVNGYSCNNSSAVVFVIWS
jgi:hypothetical protein